MIKNVLRYAILGGIFLVPLLPFVVTGSMFFPFITGKNFAFRIIISIILALWLSLVLCDPAYRPRRSPIAWGILAFLVVIGLADVFGVHPMRSFWSNFERMEGFLGLLHLGAYFLVIGSVLTTERWWKRFFTVTVIASVGVTLYAFSQLAGLAEIHQGAIRLDATLGNATYLASYLLVHIFFALLLAYTHRREKLAAVLYLCAVALQCAALFYTATRGAILGVIIGALIAALVVLVRGREHPVLRKFSGIALLTVVVIGGAFFLARNAPFVKESTTLSRIASISLQDTTVQSRFLLWTSIGWEGFKERPLLGWGQDNFIVVFGKHYDPLMYRQEPWFDRAHNVFMDWLIAGGILGLVSYLFLFGAGIYVLFRTPLLLPEKALILGLLVAYFFNNIFVFDNLISYISFITILAYVHARFTNASGAPAAEAARAIPGGKQPLAVAGSVILAAALVYFLNVPYIVRAQNLIGALTLDYSGRREAGLVKLKGTIAYGGTGVEEAKEQLVQAAVRVWGTDAAPETKEEYVRAARAAIEASITGDAGNTRPLFFLAHLVSRTTSPEEGIAFYRDALAINPTRQNFLYEIARVYLAMGKSKEAVDAYKEAYDAATENEEALGYYAGALIWDGQIEAGDRMLVERFGTTTADNPLLFEAYLRRGFLGRCVAILQLRLANIAPYDDAQTRISLALIYARMGDRDGAIEQLERAILLDPSFSAQGAEMIATVRSGGTLQGEE